VVSQWDNFRQCTTTDYDEVLLHCPYLRVYARPPRAWRGISLRACPKSMQSHTELWRNDTELKFLGKFAFLGSRKGHDLLFHRIFWVVSVPEAITVTVALLTPLPQMTKSVLLDVIYMAPDQERRKDHSQHSVLPPKPSPVIDIGLPFGLQTSMKRPASM